jgi:hypothetical protein
MMFNHTEVVSTDDEVVLEVVFEKLNEVVLELDVVIVVLEKLKEVVLELDVVEMLLELLLELLLESVEELLLLELSVVDRGPVGAEKIIVEEGVTVLKGAENIIVLLDITLVSVVPVLLRPWSWPHAEISPGERSDSSARKRVTWKNMTAKLL